MRQTGDVRSYDFFVSSNYILSSAIIREFVCYNSYRQCIYSIAPRCQGIFGVDAH